MRKLSKKFYIRFEEGDDMLYYSEREMKEYLQSGDHFDPGTEVIEVTQFKELVVKNKPQELIEE